MYIFSVLTFLQVAILEMAFAKRTPSEDITMSFELYSKPDLCGLEAFRFSEELHSRDPLELFKSSPGGTPMSVKSAQIYKAEGGAVIGLYQHRDDAEPSVAISFTIDIHEPVALKSLDHSYTQDNVHVFIKDKEKTVNTFEKIDITRPSPQFLVL